MIRLWCEWDLGSDSVVFTSHGAAYAWLAANQSFQELVQDAEEGFKNTAEVFDLGYIGFVELEVID